MPIYNHGVFRWQNHLVENRSIVIGKRERKCYSIVLRAIQFKLDIKRDIKAVEEIWNIKINVKSEVLRWAQKDTCSELKLVHVKFFKNWKFYWILISVRNGNVKWKTENPIRIKMFKIYYNTIQDTTVIQIYDTSK